MRRLWQTYRGWPRWAQVSVAAVVALVLIGVVNSGPKKKASTASSAVTSTAAAVTTTAVTTTPLPSAARQKVRLILLASVNHYERLLHAGEQAVGTTQYATANAGLAAFNDPNSEASHFRDWQTQSKAKSDLSFLDAFGKADNYYNASNEPNSMGAWRDEMNLAQQDLYEWVNLAVGWQIREHTTAQLRASEKRVERTLARARAKVAAVIAGR